MATSTTTTPEELMKQLTSSKYDFDLSSTVRFHLYHESNLYQNFLDALKMNKSIHRLRISGRFSFGITSDEWKELFNTIGLIENMREIFFCGIVPLVIPNSSLADIIIESDRTLTKLIIEDGVIVTGDSHGLERLAESISRSRLEEFHLGGQLLIRNGNQEDGRLGSLAQALANVSTLRKLHLYVPFPAQLPDESICSLIESSKTIIDLSLKWERDWSAFSSTLCHTRTRLQAIALSKKKVTSTDCTALLDAYNANKSLEKVIIYCSDRQTCLILADVLRYNRYIKTLWIHMEPSSTEESILDVQVYRVFSEMLRLNHDVHVIVQELPSNAFKDEELDNARTEFDIENKLNSVGRGTLLTMAATNAITTQRDAWIDACCRLMEASDGNPCNEITLDCLFLLLRCNPMVVLTERSLFAQSSLEPT